MYYCVFWYPTIFHQEKVHRNPDESKFFKEISDKDPTGRDFYLKVTESAIDNKPDCYHLKFVLSDSKDPDKENNAKTIESIFYYYAHTRNGFVTYTYDREKLKNDYWSKFFDSDNDQSEAIEQVRNHIIKEYQLPVHSPEFEPPSKEFIEDYIIDRILISFYHHAKGFYHEHEVQSQSDGKLIAYYYTKEYQDGRRDYITVAPTLSTKNNEVVNWFLDQFEKQFISYAERISKDHRDFSQRINLRRRSRNALASKNSNADEEIRKCLIEYSNIQKESEEKIGNKPPSISSLIDAAKRSIDTLSAAECRERLLHYTDSTSPTEIKEIRDLHVKLRILTKLCGDALTEYTYCKALLGSKYNDDYKHDRYFDNEQVELLSLYSDYLPRLSKLDERRKKAFNIRNSIRYIEGVKQDCSRWENELTENLIEHVHNISKNHEDTLEKIGELIKEVKSLSENHEDTLTKIGDLIKGVKSLSEKHEETLNTIKKLSQEANDLSGENKKMLKESEVSNRYSSILGKYSVGLGIIGEGLGKISAGLGIIGIGFAIISASNHCEILKYIGYFTLVGGFFIGFLGFLRYRNGEKKLPPND